MDASADADRATAAEPVVSALRDGIPSACVGFTGTQEGCQSNQLASLRGWLVKLRQAGFVWMRNGDCIGADEQAGLAWKEELGGKIFLHPPTINTKRAFLDHDQSCPSLPYLERNREIVDRSSLLIATPAQESEQQRGGTWSTVRYADRRGLPYLIIFPSGSYVGRNGFAQAIEARRAETGTGSVHESAVPTGCAK